MSLNSLSPSKNSKLSNFFFCVLRRILSLLLLNIVIKWVKSTTLNIDTISFLETLNSLFSDQHFDFLLESSCRNNFNWQSLWDLELRSVEFATLMFKNFGISLFFRHVQLTFT